MYIQLINTTFFQKYQYSILYSIKREESRLSFLKLGAQFESYFDRMEIRKKEMGGKGMPIYDLGRVVGPQGPKGDKGDTGDPQTVTLTTDWNEAVEAGYYYS